MQPDGETPKKEAGRSELLIKVDDETIGRLSGSARIRLRVVCSLKNFSLYTLLKRAGGAQSGEEETYEIQAAKTDFEKLERPGTLVSFRDGEKDASFEVCCMHSLLPIFEAENPLMEGLIRRMQAHDEGGWL